MPYVLYEKKDHVATITLNRPERLNAFGTELMQQLFEAEERFAGDDDAWVAVYTGAGDRAFSAGRDLKEAATLLAARCARIVAWASRPCLSTAGTAVLRTGQSLESQPQHQVRGYGPEKNPRVA